MSVFFGKNLRFLRKQKGINQGELAILVKKGHTTIGNWENGISEPSLGELHDIVNFFGVSADDLLFKDLAGDHIFPKNVNEPSLSYGNEAYLGKWF